MGNTVSTEAEKESGKLLHNKNSEKVTGLAGVGPSSYETIGPQETSHVAPELKPSVQVDDEGSHGQNKLVVGGSGSGYSLASLNPSPKNHKLTPCEYCCRLLFFFVCTLFFLCFFIAFIVLLIYPKGFTKQVLIQSSVTTLVSDVDTFYYNVRLSRTSGSYEAELGAVPCSSLKTYVEIQTGSPNGRSGSGHQQFDQLEKFAYLVSGSYINISITITSPPTSSNAPIYLYVFTLLDSYKSFLKDSDTPPYFQRHSISSNNGSVTSVTIPVTETQFYFYGLHLPKGANYYYDYIITRVFYNASDYDFPCTLTSKILECSLDLNASSLPKHNEQCVLSYCNTIENSNDLFFPLQVDLLRKKLNVINCVIMTLGIVFFLLVLAIAMYDLFQRYAAPKINASCAHIFKRKQRHEGFKDFN